MTHRTIGFGLPLPAVPGLSLRPGRGPEDWPRIAVLVNAANQADGVEEVETAANLAADIGGRDHFTMERDLLIAEVAGEAVGLVVGTRVPRDDVLALETWGAVLPAWRRRGIGTWLLRIAQTRLAAEAQGDPRPGAREFRSYTMDSEVSASALLAAEGYARIRFGFEMRRPLTGALPAADLPPGLEARPVEEAHHRAIWAADDEAFADHWGHRPATEGDFRTMFTAPHVDTALWQVAWDGDAVAGSVITAIYPEDNEAFGVARGWLDHVSVRRGWRGRGLAKALCARALEALRDAGMTEAWLGVDAANPTGALGLYEALGFTVAKRWYAHGKPVGDDLTAGRTG